MSAFDWDPETYLAEMLEEIPGYEELEDAVAAATAGLQLGTVLELGTGTGETALRILALHPAARWTGIDASDTMLRRAAERLPTADLRLGRLEEPFPPGPFDLVVSVLAVHHLDGEAKRDLFARVARVTDRFVLGDVVVPIRPEDAAIEIDGVVDVPSSVAEQLAWLGQAGFESDVSHVRPDLAVFRCHQDASARLCDVATVGRLEGKVALVVGGGSGMGRAGAVAMAAEGAAVAVSDLALDRAEAVAASIAENGGTAAAMHVDVASPELVQRLVAETVARFGRIDALYHCAADVHFVNTRDARVTELDDDVWQRIIDVHLTGTFLVLKHVGRQMVAQRSGSIIVSSTVDALVGCAGLDSYTAAKGGVTSMVRSFAAGVGRDGVRVNAIAPSFVSTEPQRVWLDDEQARATIASLHILPIPTPEQIAPFVVYLASDESAAVTGTVFPVDAGYLAFKAQVDVMGTMQAGY